MSTGITDKRASEILRKEIPDFDEQFYHFSLIRDDEKNGRLVGLKLCISPLGNTHFRQEDYSLQVRKAYVQIRAEDFVLSVAGRHDYSSCLNDPIDLSIDFSAQALILSTNEKGRR